MGAGGNGGKSGGRGGPKFGGDFGGDFPQFGGEKGEFPTTL